MPRFYFDCVCGGRRLPDDFGAQMEPEELAEQAMGLLVSLLREQVERNGDPEVSITARDDKGAVVYEAVGKLSGRFV